MKYLKPGDSENLKSPLSDDLIRTGVIGKGSCFFHAILYSDDTYRKGSTEMKEKHIPFKILQKHGKCSCPSYYYY